VKAFFNSAAALLFSASALSAQSLGGMMEDMQRMELAQNLGTVIASEDFCGLTFDQAAIADWIDTNVDASDMSFASTLDMMVQATGFGLPDMSASAKTAHCRSVENTARHYGFVQ